MRSPTDSSPILSSTEPNLNSVNACTGHAARPAKKPSWRSVVKRLNEIDAQRKAAFARRDWPAVHALDSDWHWAFRTGR